MDDLRQVTPEVNLAKEDLEKLDNELKSKYPGVKLYHLSVPYLGNFYIRGQNQADVKASNKEVEEFAKRKIAELGGENKVKAMPQDDQVRIGRDLDIEAGDISNTILLKRCVVYPYDFAKKFDEDAIMSGVIPLLIDKIMDVSGWTDINVREV